MRAGELPGKPSWFYYVFEDSHVLLDALLGALFFERRDF